MNKKMILSLLGKIVLLEAGLMLLPLIVSVIYQEKNAVWSFACTIVGAGLLGGIIQAFCRPKDKVIYAKEGFIIVAFAWLTMSLIGASPFFISGEIKSFIDAFFETVSGFTTTGASILNDVEAMSRGLLFWRSFTHWIGGMGVLVLIVAILPASSSSRSIHILRAEMPGPTMGKLVPKMRETAKILYIIYICLTAIEIVLLLCGGMPLYDSLIHAFGTAGTGGFGIKADSIASYSHYLQWVITVFMFLFGVNFNIYFFILIRRFRSAFRNAELLCYIGIALVSAAVIAFNIYPMYGSVSDSIRLSAFQVSSIMTTTGFSTADFNLWPEFSRAILLVLMFVGACAGSTSGGLKVSRLILLFKMFERERKRLIHPRSVTIAKMDGKRVDDMTLHGTGNYLAIYCLVFFAGFLLISAGSPPGFDVETNFSAMAACFNNIGPGLGLVGPATSYSAYPAFAKLVLSVAMLLGRLELSPLMIAFLPLVRRKNK